MDLQATYKDGTIKWTAHAEWKDGEFTSVLDETIGAHYLHRLVTSDVDKTIAVRLRADDGMRIWLNGEEVPED